jgi:hypothetical protein
MQSNAAPPYFNSVPDLEKGDRKAVGFYQQSSRSAQEPFAYAAAVLNFALVFSPLPSNAGANARAFVLPTAQVAHNLVPAGTDDREVPVTQVHDYVEVESEQDLRPSQTLLQLAESLQRLTLQTVVEQGAEDLDLDEFPAF